MFTKIFHRMKVVKKLQGQYVDSSFATTSSCLSVWTIPTMDTTTETKNAAISGANRRNRCRTQAVYFS
eukprot:snap_masked-scaffold_16-processed-gene-1.61-mRNA-1 protein AED:1.00 eAED:1.00 QI:0/0/0/0/1/1/2/0/67